ncbi:hypothetical protein [Occallatibacter riparius]|uniref:Uncharacterized protein n=1 Tax=Occallatibacter riparius TaxID=1002689 RepID=A0A9J7BRJ7_9BACT|nr:hypothetical protein [Occallatibacter riparius]UWZ85508.1 hypothetical protein MOP44_06095 [Occallatibacter riparius]
MHNNSAPKFTLRRERYQQGSLTAEKRSIVPDIWVYRWREPIGGGKSIQRKKIIGSVQQYRTETAARKAVDALRLDINAESISPSSMTLSERAEHYREKELGEGCGETKLTREVYANNLDSYILPRWGRRTHCKSQGVPHRVVAERIAKIQCSQDQDKGCLGPLVPSMPCGTVPALSS